MFSSANEPLALLIELTPKLAKKRFREEIYKDWDYKCGYCNDPATSLDHIVPRYRSGHTKRNNLLPCCRRCNESKASNKVEDWYEKQAFFTQARMDRIKAWTQQEVVELFNYPLNEFGMVM
jgi:hypothetical protein